MPAWYGVAAEDNGVTIRDAMRAAVIGRLQAVGPTAYAADYSRPDPCGRHDSLTVEDTAEADGAACKLADELTERVAWRALVLQVWPAAIDAVRYISPPEPGRHRA